MFMNSKSLETFIGCMSFRCSFPSLMPHQRNLLRIPRLIAPHLPETSRRTCWSYLCRGIRKPGLPSCHFNNTIPSSQSCHLDTIFTYSKGLGIGTIFYVGRNGLKILPLKFRTRPRHLNAQSRNGSFKKEHAALEARLNLQQDITAGACQHNQIHEQTISNMEPCTAVEGGLEAIQFVAVPQVWVEGDKNCPGYSAECAKRAQVETEEEEESKSRAEI
ncbi:hypothetical protein BU16DRAFT_33402 [Lophium mytilinum]|uniref:Uncharacterized protein n=1 Tax=Lophium mytilinum TaxID=390894 RepID=A0A6A6REN3_9PEZI|nr:hypothetical protein BU16DRAFT_33402 [Lophium mytilinum]